MFSTNTTIQQQITRAGIKSIQRGTSKSDEGDIIISPVNMDKAFVVMNSCVYPTLVQTSTAPAFNDSYAVLISPTVLDIFAPANASVSWQVIEFN